MAVRVYEIAKELGVDPKQVVACLVGAGRFVRSASTTLSPDDVRLVREKLGKPPISAAATTIPAWLAPADEDPRDEVAADAAALFGPAAAASVRRRSGSTTKGTQQHRRPSRPAPRLPVPAGNPETAAERRAAAREQKSIEEWALRMIDPVERRAWLEAGLGQGDVGLAEHCLAFGLTPAHLAIRVDGIRAGDRLRGGEPVGSVVARLRVGDHVADTA